MDIWPLKYFLAVARAGNLTRAAESLYISQPALSMRLAELERELGHPLFVRGPRGMSLTERGALLMRRAEDLVDFAERIEEEVRADNDEGLSGTLAIGAGETVAFAPVADAIKSLCAENPKLRIDITSGNGEDIGARIQRGTLDLALFVGPGRYKGYDYISMPHAIPWGLMLKGDAPLASRRTIRPKDLDGIPLLMTRQMMVGEFLSGWLGRDCGTLNVACTYNLAYNAAVMVAAGFGAAVCIDGVIPAAYAEDIVFRPFAPAMTSDAYLAWRKDVPLSPAAAALVSRVRNNHGESR
ncbi:MAG: LysR family transcriptional regulator [Kiritimatiellae bacterium]|nr:LysR family transcriptional regulator [Kiritimatiellia bacterium]